MTADAEPEPVVGDLAGHRPVHDPAEYLERAKLYRYVSVENAEHHLAVMSLFTSTLLTDLSASEVHAALAETGHTLRLEDVEYSCRSLEQWGNLIRSVRDARVATVSEYLRSRSRYQVSKLGGRVHRQIDEILTAKDGAREVAHELLGVTVAHLNEIVAGLEALRDQGTSAVDMEAIASHVTAVFLNQREFSESATDFYTFVQGRISRYDLQGEEFAVFKTMLLDYVELITADVARHAPVIAELVERVENDVDTLVAALDTLPRLAEEDTERSPGRRREDWNDLASWYTGRRGRSGPDQLRGAADQALGQLLSNAKRILASAGTGTSRRGDLIRLAKWFSTASDEDAHRIYDAAFGAYPTRHPVHGPDEPTGKGGATTSWWDEDAVDVPLSLRERGDRIARGRASRVPDFGLQREALLERAREEAAKARAEAAELAAVGDLHEAHLTPGALKVMLGLLSTLLGRAQSVTSPTTTVDSDLNVYLTAAPSPGRTTVVHCADGDLTVYDLELAAGSLRDAGEARSAGAVGAVGS
jgi:uncharacterized protein (TIGR02677 family)